MLKRTNQVDQNGRTIYEDEKGKKQVLPIVRQKHGIKIPDWCFHFIKPVTHFGNHWSIKKDCVVVL